MGAQGLEADGGGSERASRPEWESSGGVWVEREGGRGEVGVLKLQGWGWGRVCVSAATDKLSLCRRETEASRG